MKIFFISIEQFGYNVDLFNYCKYLRENNTITYLCPDSNHEKVEMNNIEVFYVQAYQPGLKAKLQFIQKCYSEINIANPDLIYITYFPLCSIFSLVLRRWRVNIDIRSGTIEKNDKKRKIKDTLIRIEANRFKHISAITEGLAKHLKLNQKRTTIIPLGADRLLDLNYNTPPIKNELKLLYVGTLDERNIEETIKGFAMFHNIYNNRIKATYDIIGFSYFNREKYILQEIERYNLQGIVSFLGRKKHTELICFFKSSNIGVSYIPIKSYFQYQPPTKTFEYIQNGLICIATNTIENARIIDNNNGVLIDEGAEAFYRGLEYIYLNRSSFDSTFKDKECKKYTWNHIVNNTLQGYLNKIYLYNK